MPLTPEKLLQSVTDREVGAYTEKRRGMEIGVEGTREFSAPVRAEQKGSPGQLGGRAAGARIVQSPC